MERSEMNKEEKKKHTEPKGVDADDKKAALALPLGALAPCVPRDEGPKSVSEVPSGRRVEEKVEMARESPARARSFAFPLR